MQNKPSSLRLLVTTVRAFPYMGGIETHVYEVTRRLARLGVDVTLLTTDVSRDLPAEETIEGVHIWRVPAWPSQRDLYFAPGIMRRIAGGEWDLMHCQGYHTLVPPMAMLAARRAGLPYITTFHSGGHSSTLRNAVRRVQKTLLRPLLTGSEKLVAMSRFEARVFQNQLRLPADRFMVIPNGSDLPPLESPAAPDPNTQLIVSIGRLEHYKGHHRVIDAFPAVLVHFPNARLRIVGSGPYKDALKQRVRTLGLENTITIGAVPPENRQGMTELLSRASLVTLLSEYESQGIAVWEALSLRRPVLVTHATALAEPAEDGLARSVPPDSTTDDIAAAIITQLRDPLVPTGVDLPTWDRCTESLLSLYDTVAHSSGQPALTFSPQSTL
ncbi:MAG: glycosyltransferase family 4 protein [Anaerolineae bacterium]|nr:glycosyltransferase family 4 protein [Anaerolineae bacterium]